MSSFNLYLARAACLPGGYMFC